jgi:hypothetical protein
MSLAKELAKLKAALDAPWPEEIWKAKAEIAERELSATKDEYCKTAFALTEQTERAEKAEAEVARLKEELQLARLAHAPEKAVTQKGSPNKETPLGTTLRSEEYVLAGDKNLEGEFNTVKEPAPEWREFTGTCELIQAGDEYTDPDDCWWPVSSSTVGFPASRFNGVGFRTRRPLPDPVPTQPPTQNEWRDLGSDEVICEGDEWRWKDGWGKCEESVGDIARKWMPDWSFRTRRPLPKREMPLEKELTAIEDGNPWIDPSKNILICIRYLRDEIEALKKNQSLTQTK